MDPFSDLKKKIPQIEEKIGYAFQNRNLLMLAFIHRSFINEYRDVAKEHNERLEFLGDSILGLIVADYLYHRLPDCPEGELSHLRSRLVDANSCRDFLLDLGFASYILLGRGERLQGSPKASILADVFEALIGALYLDGGIAEARAFFLTHFEKKMEEAIGNPPRNFKAELQDYSQKTFQSRPVYEVIEEAGPDHDKQFHVLVYVNGVESGLGVGRTKKEAEQKAAFEALSKREPL